MKLKVAVVMDPIESIKPYKDSTFAMLLEAQRRAHYIHYLLPNSLYVLNGEPYAQAAELTVQDKTSDWFSISSFMP